MCLSALSLEGGSAELYMNRGGRCTRTNADFITLARCSPMRSKSVLLQGFNPAEVPSAYGDTLTFWDWREHKVTQSVKLGADGLIPLARP